jgi:hypothetical protein
VGSRRIRFRPPGLKPWTKIGTLGPFRGRLGLGWVIAPLVLGLVLVVAVWLLLFRHPTGPGGTFVDIGLQTAYVSGSPVRVSGLTGPVYIVDLGERFVAMEGPPGCPLAPTTGGFTDCRGVRYALDGRATLSPGSARFLPIQLAKGHLYVDPTHPAVPRR